MEGESKKNLMKPCDIPIYGSADKAKKSAKPAEVEPGFLLSGISTVRKSLQETFAPLKGVEEDAIKFYETGVAHSKEGLAMVRSDDLFSGCFVAGTTIFGYAFGSFRGRFMKKLFYSTFGLIGGAALMRPDEAKVLAAEARVEAEKAALVAYNFIQGVGPGNNDEADQILKAVEEKTKVKPDFGQGNPEDKDLYTTRDESKK